ncbi:unnamed protein product [Phaedon cochleariae]|uniref:CXXC-type zinc finger protein 1 n=1 Tax=Phaedon cochleariae TaxID=80249 RepID=A0A9N9X306_PHACE|nr:unnamed protein product [Phaedon cochleariae]
MSRKKDISREEIAKQFLLPERQSKIDTLLKQDGQAYCICRSSDSSRFMIACDACEEWYHGDCIKISEKEAKSIKQYFCIRCKEEDSTLVTRWKTKKEQREESASVSAYAQTEAEDRKSRKRKERSDGGKADKKIKKCGECVGCYRTEDCGRCDVCTRRIRHGSSKTKERCKQRVCVSSLPGARRKRRDSSSDREQPSNAHLKTEFARHCYGPKCVNSARFGSKYCSDQCGMNLSKTRILQVLPQRLQEWALSPSAAEEMNTKALDQVRKQQVEVHQILKELDKRHKELDSIIERAKSASIDPDQENDNEEDAEISMFCVTCGLEIHSRTAIKHMEKCFNKYESQASFGSVFKTRIEALSTRFPSDYILICCSRRQQHVLRLLLHEQQDVLQAAECAGTLQKPEAVLSFDDMTDETDKSCFFISCFSLVDIFTPKPTSNNMFCDFFNMNNKTYCKRLRVLCPEHCKDPKIGDHEVCGCPLVTNVFLSTGEFCRASKKSCTKHYVWEKLRRAEIDLERVRQWLKMDELLEKERQIRTSMANRAGVLALMLHSTYNHELMERISKAQDQQSVQREIAKQMKHRFS